MNTCYHCEHEWEAKVASPRVCPSCGRDWRKPTLPHKIREAIEAFKCKPKGGVKHRSKRPLEETIKALNENLQHENPLEVADARY